MWFTIQYDTILGGSWLGGIPVKLGRMMMLAENNPDHFQPYSKKVWEAGQNIAIQKAEEAKLVFRASREEGLQLLNEAYAISAFSCHFLTDSFSAGHIRLVVSCFRLFFFNIINANVKEFSNLTHNILQYNDPVMR